MRPTVENRRYALDRIKVICAEGQERSRMHENRSAAANEMITLLETIMPHAKTDPEQYEALKIAYLEDVFNRHKYKEVLMRYRRIETPNAREFIRDLENHYRQELNQYEHRLKMEVYGPESNKQKKRKGEQDKTNLHSKKKTFDKFKSKRAKTGDDSKDLKEDEPGNETVMYTKQDKVKAKANNLCFYCGKPGHYARECRKRISNSKDGKIAFQPQGKPSVAKSP